MEIRYSTGPEDFKRYTTEDIRREFLIEQLYIPGEVTSVYSHVDRVVTLGCMPVEGQIPLDKGLDIWKNFGTSFFLERRELGLFNVGGPGAVTVDGTVYPMGYKDCLYISMGARQVLFASGDKAQPAKFYMVSAPAHRACKTTFIPMEKAAKRTLGSGEGCNERTICQFIHPDVLETNQLSMGLTTLAPGSVWNTMPSHTHERRMEVYTYLDLPEGNVVFHMMGQPTQTRHLVMEAGQAVISPSWSIHSGCGTSSYTLIWAMAGENMEFDDMDAVPVPDMR